MVFVWSRLALAALLAAGAACAPTEACPERGPCNDDGDAPRLVCSEGASFVLCGNGLDEATVAEAPSVAAVPRVAISVEVHGAHDAPARTADVLDVAPKTSPPRT